MAPEWTRSLPSISPESAPFWAACRERRLIVQRCRSCQKYQTYYRSFCCHCWSDDVEDVTASGRGTVWAATTTYRNSTQGWSDSLPYVLAAIELEEGVKMLANIINCDPADVRVGSPVAVTFVDATDEITLPYFTLA